MSEIISLAKAKEEIRDLAKTFKDQSEVAAPFAGCLGIRGVCDLVSKRLNELADKINLRSNCPPENIGRVFGHVDDSFLEGSILSPDYCIVARNGSCSKHTG